jgi:hypothetical protein
MKMNSFFNSILIVARVVSNKIFQNLKHDAENLLPGCYYYAGLQIEVKVSLAYSTVLEKETEYWDWAVYDGFGQARVNAGGAKTRDDAIALAQSWAVDFLDGKVPYKSNFCKDYQETVKS